MIFVRTVLRWALLWFVVACLAWFLFKSPESAAALVRALLGGVATAVDSGARFLERIARG